MTATATRVHAQDDQKVSAQQRKAAAEAYDRGTSAWLAGQYAQAAQWFETAHRLAPSPAALVQAIRAHKEAGNIMQAGNLSLWLKAQYDEDARANRVADEILKEAAPNYTDVVVDCNQECSITVDGKVHEYKEFFVEPGVEHNIAVGFPYGDKSDTVKGAPGETKHLAFEAPPKPKKLEPGMPGYVAPVRQRWAGLPRWATLTAIGLTVGLAGAATWSGIDTNNQANDYKAAVTAAQGGDGVWDATDCTAPGDPCAAVQAMYDHGQKLEKRTNILIGVAGGAAAVTAVLAIFFTNWSGKSTEEEAPPPAQPVEAKRVDVTGGFAYQRGGGMALLEGRF